MKWGGRMLLLRLAVANIKKRKNAAISIGVLILLTIVLLNIGFVMQLNTKNLYMDSNERLNGAHYVVRINNNEYKEEYTDFFEEDKRVNSVKTEEAAMMEEINYKVNGGEMMAMATLFPLEKEAGEGIYVPYFFQQQGYKIGDIVTFEYKKQEYTFEIAGYFETTWFGTSASSLMYFYLSNDAYKKLYSEVGGGKVISVRVNDLNQLSDIIKDFKETTDIRLDAPGRGQTQVVTADIFEMCEASTMVIGMLSVILIAFSVIIFLIVLFVIHFQIYNHIEDNIKNIGAMGAIGYTSKQIKMTIMLEYLLIEIITGIISIPISYLGIQLLGSLFSGLVGIKWRNGNYVGINLLTIVLIFLFILLIMIISTRKIRKLSPVIALRRGLATHNFRKNRFSLEKSFGNISIQMAGKNIVYNFRQYIMILLIVVGGSFACVFSLLMYINMSGEDSAFYKISGEELCDATINLANHADYNTVVSEVEKIEGVRKTSVYESSTVEIGEEMISTFVSDDFDNLETVNVYEGRLPKYNNEVVITGLMAEKLEKQVGDTIEIKYAGVSANYLICGYTQAINNFGKRCILTLDGLKRIDPSYQLSVINVYLEKDYLVENFISNVEKKFLVLSPKNKKDISEMSSEEQIKDKIEEKISNLVSMYGVDSTQYALVVNGEVIYSGDSSAYQIEEIDNIKMSLKASIGSFAKIVGIIAMGALIGTIFIIILILYFIISSMIIRHQNEFGVLKAIGYTSSKIRIQIAASFIPSALIGTLIGCILVAFTINPILTTLMKTIGVSHLQFKVYLWILFLVSFWILATIFVTSFLSARKIKKISVYQLITE